MYVCDGLMQRWMHMPMQQAVVNEHFPDAPPLHELLRSRLILTLVNNHFTLTYPMPMSPNVIEIGGLHVTTSDRALPKVSRAEQSAGRTLPPASLPTGCALPTTL